MNPDMTQFNYNLACSQMKNIVDDLQSPTGGLPLMSNPSELAGLSEQARRTFDYQNHTPIANMNVNCSLNHINELAQKLERQSFLPMESRSSVLDQLKREVDHLNITASLSNLNKNVSGAW